ncbi:sodium-coupled monocarboxylate transporter 1-like [Haliotis rubra]|uniref:sodium-coupled monocarboxylate transporter 1-like n=1 Tax=Haliotis rubra TaxID=36100 RepID=UPI001EE5FA6A|nr:sodium-coupled monocarboxylate transporter 1-like [Haliotis rubra]
MESLAFGKWDYTVFGVMVAVSVSIGIYYAIVSRHGRLDEYLLAGRSMTFLPVALSLMATFTSSITMVGASAEAYGHGIMWILSEMAFSVGNLLEIFLLLALLRRLNISSPFQFLEGRFKSRALRLIVTVLGCVENLFYLGIILFGQGMALEAVTGFSMTWSILVTSAAAVLYTTIGGLKAVIWTDVLQYMLMFIGMLAVIIKGTIDSGGIEEVWSRIMDGERLTFIFDIDPTIRHTVWNLSLGRVVTGFGWLFKPAYLQRITSTKSLTQARRHDSKFNDNLKRKSIYVILQVLPFMMLDIFRNLPGMPGLFLAAVFSASLRFITVPLQ